MKSFEAQNKPELNAALAHFIGKKGHWDSKVSFTTSSECGNGTHPSNRKYFQPELNMRHSAKLKIQKAREKAVAEAHEKERAENNRRTSLQIEAEAAEALSYTRTLDKGAAGAGGEQGEGTGNRTLAWTKSSSAASSTACRPVSNPDGTAAAALGDGGRRMSTLEIKQLQFRKQQVLRKQMKKQLRDMRRRRREYSENDHTHPSFTNLFKKATMTAFMPGETAAQLGLREAEESSWTST